MAASTTITVSGLPARLTQIVQGIQPGKIVFPTKVIGAMVVSDIKKNFSEGHSPDGVKWKALAHGRLSGGAGLPLRDNGLLLASITSRITGNEIAAGSGLEYAGVHQWGKVIKPTKAKMLAIPVTKEAKRAGGPRNFPKPLTLIVFGKSGKGVLAESPPAKPKGKKSAAVTAAPAGKRPMGKVHFVLVSSVTVPARPFVGLSAGLMDRIEMLLIDVGIKAASA